MARTKLFDVEDASKFVREHFEDEFSDIMAASIDFSVEIEKSNDAMECLSQSEVLNESLRRGFALGFHYHATSVPADVEFLRSVGVSPK